MHKGIISWKNLVVWAFNFFSIPLLIKTLFAPWQMDRGDGDNFDWIEKITFAVFSRVLGFVARVALISLGLIFTLLVVCTYPIFFLLPIDISRERLVKWGSIGSSLSYGNTFFLNRFGVDMSAHNDVVLYGKEKYLRMILRGLGKDTDHNVLLVGEVGVGKKTLIDHLGSLGASGLSPHGIMHHRVVELPIENMSAENILAALSEAESAGNVIVVLNNLEKYEALYENILPYLTSQNLAIIATVDLAGYDSVLKKHSEFLSKFEKVDIFPPSTEETVAIVANYASVRGVAIENALVEELVNLAGRYIGNMAEPQRSITIIDALPKKGANEDTIKSISSDKANIPIGALSIDEKSVLLSLESTMQSKIIGQDEAVREVAQAMKRMRAGVANPNKPAGTFLFLGPTGVGKTYTAKVLAQSYFGRKDAMVRFDMSEFAPSDSLDTFSERLSAIIEEAPMSLVFFDELEKAHRNIHNLLLQVLDEGRLTRETGRTVNFREAIIIATSNAGSREIVNDANISKDALVDILINERVFTPEFLNRFSGIMLFKPLTEEDVRKVTALLLAELKARVLAEKGIEIEISQELIDKVTLAGFDSDFGARPINRAIEEIVENRLADMILKGEASPGQKVTIL